jgi:hypothetical protein
LRSARHGCSGTTSSAATDVASPTSKAGQPSPPDRIDSAKDLAKRAIFYTVFVPVTLGAVLGRSFGFKYGHSSIPMVDAAHAGSAAAIGRLRILGLEKA